MYVFGFLSSSLCGLITARPHLGDVDQREAVLMENEMERSHLRGKGGGAGLFLKTVKNV